MTDSNQSYQEKLNLLKTEQGAETTSMIQKVEEERDKYAQKFEEKRKQLKELERQT